MGVLLKLLGVVDMVIAVAIMLFEAGLLPFWVFLPFVLDLVVKAVVFRSGAATVIDAVIAAYLLLLPVIGMWVVSGVIVVYLLQKGFVSLL